MYGDWKEPNLLTSRRGRTSQPSMESGSSDVSGLDKEGRTRWWQKSFAIPVEPCPLILGGWCALKDAGEECWCVTTKATGSSEIIC